MKNNYNKYSYTAILLLFFSVVLLHTSCKKYLEAKPDASLSTPETLTDLQLMLDYYALMNQQYPVASEIMCDDYYLIESNFNSVTDATQRNLHTWQKDDNTLLYWGQGNVSGSYAAILHVNTVLDELPHIRYSSSEQDEWNNIKGSALFFRACYFYGLSQLFAKPYDKTTASTDAGIVLRLNSNVQETSVRSSVEQTYDRIIKDFKEAADLLPVTPLVKSRPSKPAAYGALARTYLAMGEYALAGEYADKCLALYNKLMNYNSLSANANVPIQRFNDEVIFQMRSQGSIVILANSRARIDPALYSSYAAEDLRKSVFFKSNNNGSYQFKGDYDGSGTATGFVFAGIVTDEIYLIRAESYARAGNVTSAMKDLNDLLVTRWSTNLYNDMTAADPDEALTKILTERRKELVRRGARWTDLRRLMKEPAHAVIPKRVIGAQTYELDINSPRYTMQIPNIVITLSGIPQNE